MELTEGSETSVNHNLTPGKYPKEHIQYSKHGESFKIKKFCIICRGLDISIYQLLFLHDDGYGVSRNI
jgi:hypothetical protein